MKSPLQHPAKRTAGAARRVARADMVQLQIDDFPLDLKRKLIRAARNTNVNDVAVAILSREFSVPFVPSGMSSPIPPTADSGHQVLKMPRKLRLKIKNAAAARDVAARTVVIEVLTTAMRGRHS